MSVQKTLLNECTKDTSEWVYERHCWLAGEIRFSNRTTIISSNRNVTFVKRIVNIGSNRAVVFVNRTVNISLSGTVSLVNRTKIIDLDRDVWR